MLPFLFPYSFPNHRLVCHVIDLPFIPLTPVPYTLFIPILYCQKQSHQSPYTLSFEYSIPLTLTPHSISSLRFNSLAIHIDFSSTPSPTTYPFNTVHTPILSQPPAIRIPNPLSNNREQHKSKSSPDFSPPLSFSIISPIMKSFLGFILGIALICGSAAAKSGSEVFCSFLLLLL